MSEAASPLDPPWAAIGVGVEGGGIPDSAPHPKENVSATHLLKHMLARNKLWSSIKSFGAAASHQQREEESRERLICIRLTCS